VIARVEIGGRQVLPARTSVSPWVEDDRVERILFASKVAAIGTLASPPDSTYFSGEHQVTNYLIAFPRSSLWIRQDRGDRFVADPTVATMYNRGQVLRRRAISPQGDVGEWFAVAEDVARDAVRMHDPGTAAGPAPLRFTHAEVPPALYRRQRTVASLVRQQTVEPEQVDELVIGLFGEVVDAAYARAGHRFLARDTTPMQRELVERAKAVLSRTYTTNLTVDEIACHCECSTYHLCRTFRQHTGQTLHGYRRDLRLRIALGLVGNYRGDLARLAMELGFFSHSHFSGTFQRQFGVSPSDWVASGAGSVPA
jgi:AraC-like DNA-binding protein